MRSPAPLFITLSVAGCHGGVGSTAASIPRTSHHHELGSLAIRTGDSPHGCDPTDASDGTAEKDGVKMADAPRSSKPQPDGAKAGTAALEAGAENEEDVPVPTGGAPPDKPPARDRGTIREVKEDAPVTTDSVQTNKASVGPAGDETRPTTQSPDDPDDDDDEPTTTPEPKDSLEGVNVAEAARFELLYTNRIPDTVPATPAVIQCPPRSVDTAGFGGAHEVFAERFEKGSSSAVHKGLSFLPDGTLHWLALKTMTPEASGALVRTLQRDKAALELLQDSKIAPQLVAHMPFTSAYCGYRTSVMVLAGDRTLHYLNRSVERHNLSIHASIAIEGLKLLRTLHSFGIIHGDIHMGNLVFFRDAPIAKTLRLIDFGLAAPFVDSTTGKHILDTPRGDSRIVWTPTLLSPFELAGSTPTRRDDLYRFAEIFVSMVLGDKELVALESRDASPKTVLEWKTARDVSRMDYTFARFYEYAKNLRFDERPDYEMWISKFRRILGTGADKIVSG